MYKINVKNIKVNFGIQTLIFFQNKERRYFVVINVHANFLRIKSNILMQLILIFPMRELLISCNVMFLNKMKVFLSILMNTKF